MKQLLVIPDSSIRDTKISNYALTSGDFQSNRQVKPTSKWPFKKREERLLDEKSSGD